MPDDANDLRGYHFRRLLGKPADLDPDRDPGGRRRRPPARSSSAPRSAPAPPLAVLLLALLVVFAIADSRAARRLLRRLRRPARPGARRPQPAAGSDAAAAQGRRPLRRAHPLRPASPTASRASSPSTPTRKSPPTARATGRPTTTATRSAWSRCPSAPRSSPSSSASASSACAPWRSFEDAFRRSKERVKLESEALDEQYEIFSGKEPGPRLAAPALLPHLHRLAHRRGAEEVRLRARRRHPLLLRPRPQGEGRRASTPSRAASAAVARRLREESLE